MQTVTEMAPRLGVALTCAALALPRATYYRGQQPRPEPKPRPTPAPALPPEFFTITRRESSRPPRPFAP